MNNFERITASPEALGDFLGALPILSGPWDDDFHRVFCDSCNDTDLTTTPEEIKTAILENDKLLREREAGK